MKRDDIKIEASMVGVARDLWKRVFRTLKCNCNDGLSIRDLQSFRNVKKPMSIVTRSFWLMTLSLEVLKKRFISIYTIIITMVKKFCSCWKKIPPKKCAKNKMHDVKCRLYIVWHKREFSNFIRRSNDDLSLYKIAH